MSKSLTLVAASNINHILTEFAIYKTINSTPINEILIACDRQLNIGLDYSFLELNENFNIFEYSKFCLKKMNDYIKTSHVIIVQYDGMAVNKKFWNEEYLEYDYVGSPISNQHAFAQQFLNNLPEKERKNFQNLSPKWFVGGGGLSIRSKKLLDILANDDKIQNYLENEDEIIISYPEDWIICFLHRDYLINEYGIKFAPIEVGLNFCSELISYQESLGFHGLSNIPLFLNQEECLFYIQHLDGVSEKFNLQEQNLHKFYMNCRFQGYDEVVLEIENKFKLTEDTINKIEQYKKIRREKNG